MTKRLFNSLQTFCLNADYTTPLQFVLVNYEKPHIDADEHR